MSKLKLNLNYHLQDTVIPKQWNDYDIKTYNEKINYYNNKIKIITDDMKDGELKAYVFHSVGNFPRNYKNKPIVKAFSELTEILKIQQIDCPLGNINRNIHKSSEPNAIWGLVFKRNGKHLIWVSVADMSIKEFNDKFNYLYIDYLCGVGGTYKLFEKLKEIIMNNGKGQYCNLGRNIAFMELQSLRQYNTVTFYDRNGGKIINDYDYIKYEKNIIQALKLLKTQESYYYDELEKFIQEKIKLNEDVSKYDNPTQWPAVLKEKIKNVNMEIEKIYDEFIEGMIGGLNFYWTYNTPTYRKFIKQNPDYKHMVRFDIDNMIYKAILYVNGLNEEELNSEPVELEPDEEVRDAKRIREYYIEHPNEFMDLTKSQQYDVIRQIKSSGKSIPNVLNYEYKSNKNENLTKLLEDYSYDPDNFYKLPKQRQNQLKKLWKAYHIDIPYDLLLDKNNNYINESSIETKPYGKQQSINRYIRFRDEGSKSESENEKSDNEEPENEQNENIMKGSGKSKPIGIYHSWIDDYFI